MMWWARLAAPVVVLAAVAALAVGDRTRPYAPEPQDDLGQMISYERGRRGVPPVSGDVRLTCAAKAHARDLADRRICTKTGANGEGIGQRAEACGYPWMGGNVEVICQALTASAALDYLLRYPEKRQAILDYGARHVGVGFSDYYWVVIVAR